jgi:O-antigen ligase
MGNKGQAGSETLGFLAGLSGAETDFLKVLVFGGATLLIGFVSIISPYLGIAALGLLGVALLLGLNLRWGMLCLVFLMPFDPQIELKPGFYLYFDLLFVVPFLVYLWRVMFEKFHVNWISFAMFPYVLFAVVSTYWRAENLFWFAGYSARLIVAVLFMAVVAGIGRAESITAMLGLSMVPSVVYGIYQELIDSPGPLYFLFYPHYEGYAWSGRARGFFFTENNLGGYCAIVSVMLLAIGLRTKTPRIRFTCYVLALFGFLGVASSGSRGAWVAVIAGILMLFVYSEARLGAKVLLAAAVVAVILVALSVSFEPWSRVQTLDNFTVDTRTSMSLAALLLFVQHPVIGVGLTNYQELMSSVINWDYEGNAAHNTYLQILSENGIIGFLLFFGPVFYLFYRNLKRAKESTPALLICVGLTVFFVHGLFDFQFTTAPQYLLLFAILFGLSAKSAFEPVSVPVVTA